jgi:hypothetical protein
VFEKRVLRRIFGRKRDEVTGAGRNLIRRSFMICTSKYYSVDKIKKNEMGGTCNTFGGGGGAYRIVVGRPDGKRPFGRHRSGRQDNIEKEIQGVGWGHGVD